MHSLSSAKAMPSVKIEQVALRACFMYEMMARLRPGQEPNRKSDPSTERMVL